MEILVRKQKDNYDGISLRLFYAKARSQDGGIYVL